MMVLIRCIAFDVAIPGGFIYSTFCSPFGILASYISVYDLYTPKAVAHLLYQLHFHQCQQIQQMLLSLTYYYYIVATTIRTTCMDNSKTTTKITTTLFDLLYNQIILYMITTFYDIAITS